MQRSANFSDVLDTYEILLGQEHERGSVDHRIKNSWNALVWIPAQIDASNDTIMTSFPTIVLQSVQ